MTAYQIIINSDIPSVRNASFKKQLTTFDLSFGFWHTSSIHLQLLAGVLSSLYYKYLNTLNVSA
jgi:hypothetical protein